MLDGDATVQCLLNEQGNRAGSSKLIHAGLV